MEQATIENIAQEKRVKTAFSSFFTQSSDKSMIWKKHTYNQKIQSMPQTSLVKRRCKSSGSFQKQKLQENTLKKAQIDPYQEYEIPIGSKVKILPKMLQTLESSTNLKQIIRDSTFKSKLLGDNTFMYIFTLNGYKITDEDISEYDYLVLSNNPNFMLFENMRIDFKTYRLYIENNKNKQNIQHFVSQSRNRKNKRKKEKKNESIAQPNYSIFDFIDIPKLSLNEKFRTKSASFMQDANDQFATTNMVASERTQDLKVQNIHFKPYKNCNLERNRTSSQRQRIQDKEVKQEIPFAKYNRTFEFRPVRIQKWLAKKMYPAGFIPLKKMIDLQGYSIEKINKENAHQYGKMFNGGE